MKNRCAVCAKTRAPLIEYPTILQSMGISGNKYAHTKCILKVQQQALNFKARIATRMK